ncbi:MAG: hypothetical protein K2H44_05400 [Muribaculaceae bacterium]|nr:hypothetical protein [Muribaculaceae bacterium]MDE5844803.1 hypothetical protein [Muribaculaceae bacterium]
MKRKLLKQMLKEWRSNIWLVVELIIVGSAMAGIMALLFYILNIRYQPSGYDVKDTYVISLDRIGRDSPEYNKFDDLAEKYSDEVFELMSRVRALPEVELLGYGHNAMPFNYNYAGNRITSIQDNDTIKMSGLNTRLVSPEIPIILNLKGVDGETSEQLSQMIERGEIIITDIVRSKKAKPSECIGRSFVLGNDSIQYRLAAVIPGMKRVDFEAPGTTLLLPYNKKLSKIYEFIVKIKHGTDKEFLKQIKENPDQWRAGNLCVMDVSSTDIIRADANRTQNQTIAGMIVCCSFLLISIFLGLLGTFWFRTGQRTVEIAIRMVNGATNRQIFTRLLTEGIILWSVALIFIAILMFVIFKFDVLSEVVYDEMTKSIIYGTIISLVSLLIMIIAGIFFPALRATKIKPAIALKDE